MSIATRHEGQTLPHTQPENGVADVDTVTDLPNSVVARPVIAGYVEKMMRVRGLKSQSNEAGEARFGVMDTGHWVLDLDGRPTGAAAAVIMDTTLAASLRDAVPALHRMVTTELHLNFTRPLPTDGTVLESVTRALVGDEAGGMATGMLRGPDGTHYVQATGWFYGVDGNTDDGLDRYETTAKRPLGAEEGLRLGALLAATAGPLSRKDFDGGFLSGLSFARKETLRNSHGTIHGGALMIMAAMAAQQTMLDRTDFDLQSLRVSYLRPASGTIASRTKVRHAGSSIRVVDVELFSGERNSTEKAFVNATLTLRRTR